MDRGTLDTDGWPANRGAYSVSKALLNALTIDLAKEHPDVYINACCPGWIDTEMRLKVGKSGKLGSSIPTKTEQDGAIIPLRLAVVDIGGLTGKYWANETVFAKGDGRVQNW